MERRIVNGKWNRSLGWVVVFSVALTATTVGLLHVLQPELNPFARAISEYVHGRYGFLMTWTFFSQSLGSLALAAIAIGGGNGQRKRQIGGVLFVVAALGAAVAGVFSADLGVAYPQTPTGTVHAIAGLVRFGALMFALPLLSATLVAHRPSGKATKVLILLSRLFVVAFVMSILILANIDLFGLGQRTFIAVLLLWMLIAVYPFIRRGPP